MAHFILHLSSPRHGFTKARVEAERGELWRGPDLAQVRAALPYAYRKAWDRFPGFWFDKYDATKPGHMALDSARGKPLNTLYAIPVE